MNIDFDDSNLFVLKHASYDLFHEIFLTMGHHVGVDVWRLGACKELYLVVNIPGWR
jgi:hypothetical protein